MHAFSFQYPAVFAAFGLYVLCLYFCKARTQSLYLPHLKNFAPVLGAKTTILHWLQHGFVFFLITAAASPVLDRGMKENSLLSRDIVLALDLSGSMGYKLKNSDQSRFKALQGSAAAFLQNRSADRVGLVGFATKTAVISPLTFDRKITKDLLNRQKVGLLGQKTALRDGLYRAYGMLLRSTAHSKVAVLFTDGSDNASAIPKPVLADVVEHSGVKLYVIGFLLQQNTWLKQLAQKGGGRFFHAEDDTGLKEVFARIDRLERSRVAAPFYKDYLYLYIYPLFAAFILLGLYLYAANKRGV